MAPPGLTGVRALHHTDLELALDLLDQRPVDNVFVASRVDASALEAYLLGCPVWGRFEDGRLCSMLHVGANLVPVAATLDDLPDYVERLGQRRHVSSIMGPADQVMPLWEGLCARWGRSWSSTREVRCEQPVMALEGPAAVAADPRVRRITMDDFDAYFDAAVRMYTEEVGVSPLEPSGSYRAHVRRAITLGRSFGIVEDGQVLYKSDVGCAHGDVCQVQGVWMHPDLRGRGNAAAAMAAVVDLCHETWPVVTLYVNDYNLRARRLYERVGFTQIGTFATILY